MRRGKFFTLLLAAVAVVALSAALPFLLLRAQDAGKAGAVEQRSVSKAELNLLSPLTVPQKLNLLAGANWRRGSSVSIVAMASGRARDADAAEQILTDYLSNYPLGNLLWDTATPQIGYCTPYLLLDNQGDGSDSLIIWSLSFSSDEVWGNAWLDDESGAVLAFEIYPQSGTFDSLLKLYASNYGYDDVRFSMFYDLAYAYLDAQGIQDDYEFLDPYDSWEQSVSNDTAYDSNAGVTISGDTLGKIGLYVYDEDGTILYTLYVSIRVSSDGISILPE